MTLIDYSNLQLIIQSLLPLGIIISVVGVALSRGSNAWISTFFAVLLIGGITNLFPVIANNMARSYELPALANLKEGICFGEECDLSKLGCDGVCEAKKCDDGGILGTWQKAACTFQSWVEGLGKSAIETAVSFTKVNNPSFDMENLNKLSETKGLMDQVRTVAVYLYPFALGISFIFMIIEIFKGNGIPDVKGFMFSILGYIAFMVAMPFIQYSTVAFFSNILTILNSQALGSILGDFFGGMIITGGLSFLGLLLVIMIIFFIILEIVKIGWLYMIWMLFTFSPIAMSLQPIFPDVPKNIINLTIKYSMAMLFSFFIIEVGMLTFAVDPMFGTVGMIFCFVFAIKSPSLVSEILGSMGIATHLGMQKVAQDIKRGQEMVRDNVTWTTYSSNPGYVPPAQNVTGTFVNDLGSPGLSSPAIGGASLSLPT